MKKVFCWPLLAKKGLETADGTNFPNYFYDFESDPMIYLWKIKIKC